MDSSGGGPATTAAAAAAAARAKPRGLKFCPESNDLLYPRENRATRRLEFYCKNCDFVEEAAPEDYCVHVSRIKHDVKEQVRARCACCACVCAACVRLLWPRGRAARNSC